MFHANSECACKTHPVDFSEENAQSNKLCDFGMGDLSSGRLADRIDALVWAVTNQIERGDGARVHILQ
jgi:phage terminase large subunit-like protein